jgi:hypothetical protein
MLASQEEPYAWTVAPGMEHANFWTYVRPTPIPNVALLPGRTEAIGVPVLIPSLRWRELVQLLQSVADVIIFDGPSALIGPDAALLAPHVEGVVLTLDPAIDSREDVSEAKSRLLRQNNSNLLGAVTFTPSKHPFGGRKALNPPGQPADAVSPAPPISRKPPRSLIDLRLFGRQFRVVWGASGGKRSSNAATNGAMLGALTDHVRTGSASPAPGTPIITPPPVPEPPAHDPPTANVGQLTGVTPSLDDGAASSEDAVSPVQPIITPPPTLGPTGQEEEPGGSIGEQHRTIRKAARRGIKSRPGKHQTNRR